MKPRAIIVIAGCLAAMASAAGQTPARDNAVAAATTTGTASLSGVLVTDETQSHPIRRATVTLGSGELGSNRMTVTDDAGRFAFTNLPDGRFTVTAARPGFISAAYGAKRPTGAGSPLTLGPGQQLSGITIKMLRGAVISGTVRDANGDPMPDMTINVMFYTFGYQTGERTLTAANAVFGDRTDDRGAYRIYGLPPGEYVVLVTQGFGPRSDPGARQMTAEDYQWAVRQIQQAGQVSVAAPSAAPLTGPVVAYAPVFYAGTTRQANAATITLAAGEERTGVDIPMQFIRTSKVVGTIVLPGGDVPPNLQVNMVAQDRIDGLPFAGFMDAASVKDGQFTFPGLAPGTYTVTVRVRPGPAPRGGGAGASAAAMALYGIADVTVNGADTPVTVTLQPGVTVSGRLIFDGTTLPPPADLTKMRVNMNAVQTGKGAAIGVSPATADAAGAFRFTGVAPGRYQMTASVPGSTPAAGWQIKRAFVNGSDALDAPFAVRTDDVGDAVLTFTDRPTELSGRIQDAAGRPAPEYFLIVFPADRALWTPQSRRIQSKRPSNDGRYSVPNLPPGDYLIAAVTDLEQGQAYDPSFLQQLVPQSMKVTISEGEKKVQDIKIAGGL